MSFPDVTSVVVPTTAPFHVHDDTAAYLTAVSLVNANKTALAKKIRIEYQISAVAVPTRLTMWVQFRSNSGTWFDCCQPGMNVIQIDDVLAKISPTPVLSVLCDAEGDEVRIGYKGEGCVAGDGNAHFSFDELNIVKMF